jgi:hypothetical protein
VHRQEIKGKEKIFSFAGGTGDQEFNQTRKPLELLTLL